MKKWMALLLSLVLIVGLLCSCGQTKEQTTVRLSEVTHSVFYAPMYAALKQIGRAHV